METAPLTPADETLLDHATDLNRETFDPEFFDGAHIVAASVRTADGAFHDGVSLPASIGRASTCAEPGALSTAIAAGNDREDIEACVAVAYPMADHETDEQRPIPPCGVCREMLADYNPEIRVVVPIDSEVRTVRTGDLLPVRPW